MMNFISSLFIGAAMTIGSWFGLHQPVSAPIADAAPTFGAFNPTGGGTYRLQSSVGLSNTTITLSSLKEPISNIPYTMTYLGSSVGYGTLDPQSSRSEFVSFTGITQNSNGTAQLTGVTRGLTRTPAGNLCTASTTLTQAHSGQSIFILSDSPCLFAEYYVLRNNATSTGILVFSSTTPPRYDQPGAQAGGTYISTTSELASIAYVNAIAVSGASNATESVKGISELATGLEQASSTILGSTGAGLVTQARYATDTPQTGCAAGYTATAGAGCSVIASLSGKIKQSWLDLTQAFTVSGAWIFNTAAATFNAGFLSNASSTLSATTTIAANSVTNNALRLNGLAYAFPSSQTTNSFLKTDGSGTLTWASPGGLIIATSTKSRNITNNTAADVLFATTTIPANALGTANAIRITVPYVSYSHLASGSGGSTLAIALNYGGVALCTATWTSADTITSKPLEIEATIIANGTSAQACSLRAIVYPQSQSAIGSGILAGGYLFLSNGTGAIDDTASQNLTITAQWAASSGSNAIQTQSGAIVEKIF